MAVSVDRLKKLYPSRNDTKPRYAEIVESMHTPSPTELDDGGISYALLEQLYNEISVEQLNVIRSVYDDAEGLSFDVILKIFRGIGDPDEDELWEVVESILDEAYERGIPTQHILPGHIDQDNTLQFQGRRFKPNSPRQ